MLIQHIFQFQTDIPTDHSIDYFFIQPSSYSIVAYEKIDDLSTVRVICPALYFLFRQSFLVTLRTGIQFDIDHSIFPLTVSNKCSIRYRPLPDEGQKCYMPILLCAIIVFRRESIIAVRVPRK